MDIYEYFNSRDVAEHCKQLSRSFTGRELAYMIWQSNHHTLAQKVVAWEELIRTMPDETLEDGIGLHHFLRQYITRLQQFISEFQGDAEGCVYSYEKLYKHAPERYLDESVLYASYEDCVAAAVAEDDWGTLSFRIRKKVIHKQAASQMGDAMLDLTPDGEPTAVFVAPYFGAIDLLVEPFGFHGWYVEIPTPFKKGDIVTGVDLWGRRSEPMVVDKLPSEHGEDYLDMCAHLWELDRYQRLDHNKYVCYLSLEYYRGDLVEQKRFLYTLHNYIQNGLPLSDLLRSYTVILLDSLAAKQANFFGWAEDVQHLTGLDKDVIHVE